MDFGLDLIANPSKIKKKKYIKEKRDDDFDLNEFILETIIEELNINLLEHPKSFIKNIIDVTLKIANENKNVSISHLENMSLEDKKKGIIKLPIVLTKKLALSSKIVEKKEPSVEVKKLPEV
tara:strand:+ start:272 stop:637 length:366 start_codon:yes stop_codon:yes gene_type:complete